LSLKSTPDPVSSGVRYANNVLKFGREGAMNPGEHHLVHQKPILRRVRDRQEDVVGEGVPAKGLQDLIAPPGVLSGGRRKDVGDGGPDAGEGRRLSMKRGAKGGGRGGRELEGVGAVASGCGGAIRHTLVSETAVGLGVLALNGVDNRLLLLKSTGGVLCPLASSRNGRPGGGENGGSVVRRSAQGGDDGGRLTVDSGRQGAATNGAPPGMVTCGKPGASSWERSRAASGRESAGAGEDPSWLGAAARVADWVGAGGGGSTVGGSVAVSTKACPGGVPAAAKGDAWPGTAGKGGAGDAARAEGALTAEGRAGDAPKAGERAAAGAVRPGGAPAAGERAVAGVARPGDAPVAGERAAAVAGRPGSAGERATAGAASLGGAPAAGEMPAVGAGKPGGAPAAGEMPARGAARAAL
jgi:hypothetical protein